jgi:RimJ/RimL family protein N-acetyltransferase
MRPYKLNDGIYELGVHLCADRWGKGYATEAGAAVIKYAFEKLVAKGLFAGHHPFNVSSRDFLLKLGFLYTHDEYYPPTGLQHPSYFLSVDEFNSGKKV